MKVDGKATAQAPKGWTIWQTSRSWQAMRDDATERRRNAWGRFRQDAASAVSNAADWPSKTPGLERGVLAQSRFPHNS